jgi:signal transduction histidine kinase
MPLSPPVFAPIGRRATRKLGLRRRLDRIHRRPSPRPLANAELAQIALYLHDEVGQWLALAMLQVDTLATEHAEAVDGLTRLRATLGQAAAAVHETIRCLDAEAIPTSLLSAMERALASGPWGGHPLVARLAPELAQLAETRAPVASRIVRELVANAHRHARATHVEVRVWQRDGMLHLRVHDNGRGLTDPDPMPHYGLGSLRRQITMEGGSLHIHSAAGSGTRIAVNLPLRPWGGASRAKGSAP